MSKISVVWYDCIPTVIPISLITYGFKEKQNVEFVSFAIQSDEKIIKTLHNWLLGNTTNNHNRNQSLSF